VARLAALAALLALGCAGGPLDSRALEARHPELARIDGQRLAQITPYAWPHHDTLRWFTCRWQLDRPLRVSLPPDLAARDRELLLQALASLESAGLGLRIDAHATPERADVHLALADADAGKSGRTSADCAVHEAGDRLAAELVRADVSLQRNGQNMIGKVVALSEAEWVGAAIHELGHALGFQGHVRSGPGPMVRNVEEVRAIGRRVLRGEPLSAPSLRALYSLPSGTLLRRDSLAAGRTRELDRLDALARERGYRGPFLRVGDVSALIDWREPGGRVVGLWLPALRDALADPARLRIELDPVARAWLGAP
jgi:hypothetical protein